MKSSLSHFLIVHRLSLFVCALLAASALLAGRAHATCEDCDDIQDQVHFDVAFAAFNEAVRLKPDVCGTCLNIGNTDLEQGAYDEAGTEYRRTPAVDPEYTDARRNLEAARHKLEQKGDGPDR